MQTKKGKEKRTVAAGRIRSNLDQSEAAFLNDFQTAIDKDLPQLIQTVKSLVLIWQPKAWGKCV